MKILKKIILSTITLALLILFLAYLSSRGRIGEETTIARNISYQGKKVSLIERVEKNKRKTSLLIKEDGKKRVIDTYHQNNEIPDKIVDVFTFKTKKDEYIIAIVDSYVRVNNEIVHYDGHDLYMYIYNSKGQEMYQAEQSFYLNDKKEYQEFDLGDKNAILKKLKELEAKGEL